MLRDFRLDDLGQVCTLSRQDMDSAASPSLSASLQGSLRFLPVPIPPEDLGFTRLRLIRLLFLIRTDPMGLNLFHR